MVDINKDNGKVAWEHFLQQFEDSPKLRAVVKGLYAEYDTAAKALEDLLMKRWVDTAVGAQLDGVGDIVGKTRLIHSGQVTYFGFKSQSNSGGFGEAPFRHSAQVDTGTLVALSDSDYRNVLRWKIALNKSRGTAPDIAATVNAIFGGTSTKISDTGNASIQIDADIQLPSGNPLLENPERWFVAAAGVKINFGGLEQIYDLQTEDGDQLQTESGDDIQAEVYS